MSTDDEAVREAEAWFTRYPGLKDILRQGNASDVTCGHAATIVRAWLARDVPAPAGRDLTPKDVRDALATVGTFPCSGLDRVAEHLSRIARPSGGAGAPDTAEPDVPRDERWGAHGDEDGDAFAAAQLADRSPRPPLRGGTPWQILAPEGPHARPDGYAVVTADWSEDADRAEHYVAERMTREVAEMLVRAGSVSVPADVERESE